MESNKPLVLEEFLAPLKQDIPNEGFSNRVMSRLPQRGERSVWPALLWNGLVLAVFALLFVWMGGASLLAYSLVPVWHNMLSGLLDVFYGGIDMRMVAAGMALCLCAAYLKISELA